MSADESRPTYRSASQRVAATYQRLLSDFNPVMPAGSDETQQEQLRAAQADLHAFFLALYDELYAAPEQFGMPPAEDIFLVKDHDKEGPDKTEVKRVLDRQRKVIEEGMLFLSAAGQQGWLEDERLVLSLDSPALAFLKKKSGRAWVKGLEKVGWVLAQTDNRMTMANERFPRMMPALKLLAESCAKCEDANKGQVFFSRCDFHALQHDFEIAATDLFRIFSPEDAAWAMDLHTYFTGRKYQDQVGINRMFSWTVKYQGKRSIKATPLFQLEFDERLQRKIRAGIKCASAQRIVPLLASQSQALQEDFMLRVNTCGSCHWCDNQKTLGPVVVEYKGEERKICWYVNYDIEDFSPEMAGLVREYTQMHERLE